MGEITVRGGWKAREVARAFERAADGDLRRELRRALDEGAKPMIDAAHRSAMEDLPKHNGLNLIVAAARITVHSLGATSIRIIADGIDQLYRIDKIGTVEHPTYGHRPRVTQRLRDAEGWFTEAMEHGEPHMRRELERALERVARRIGRSA